MSLLDLIYPPACMHCHASLDTHAPLCPECLESFTLLSEEGHCGKCFTEIPTIVGTCKPCQEIRHSTSKLSSCFDAYGPAKSLVKGFEQGQYHLAKDIAAYLLIQLDLLRFPTFDTITIAPNHFQSPQALIAKEVAKALNCPFKFTLKRHFTPNPTFSLKKKCNIINQKVLLLGISMQTRNTLRSAAWALDLGGPETIYGMTFCAT